jgi:hypothetical protein
MKTWKYLLKFEKRRKFPALYTLKVKLDIIYRPKAKWNTRLSN